MTFVIKVRGAPTGIIASEYHCNLHGRFALDVERTAEGDAPDTFPCQECGDPAVWCISAPMARVQKVTAAKHGKWEKPERKTWTDTSAIAEGQPLYDWKEDRAKIWEEKRKQDVVDFAKWG